MVLVAGILIIVILIFFGSNRQPLNHKQPLKIGVLMPLSSDFAWWGEAVRDSIQTAQAKGYMKDAEFVFQDTKCSPKDAVSATFSLKALYPSMNIFIVGCDSDLKAMLPILNKDTDLAFMVGLSGADLYQTDFPIINLAYRLETEGEVAAEFAAKKLGAKTFGVIVDDGNFGNVLNNSIAEYFKSINGRVITEKLKYNEANPETSLLKLLQAKPDAVYIQNDIPAISIILKRLKQLGYQGKIMVYYGGRDQSLIDTAGNAAEGVYIPWAISDNTNQMKEDFIYTFKKMFNKEPFITSYFMYDGVVLLQEAASGCANNARCIEKYIYDKKDFDGTLGGVKYKIGGEVDRNLYFEQVRDGKFIEL